MKVHHIGYLVRNINKAKHAFSCLGYEPTSEVTLDDYRNVWICFMQKDDWNIELVSPAGETSVVQGLVKRIRNAPYHLCYESCTFDADAAGLKENGFMQIDQSMPAPALENRRVCFFINSQIGMIELLEEKDESFRRGAPLVILALLGQDDRLFICFFLLCRVAIVFVFTEDASMKILALSGWVPEQICDTVRYVQTVARREISHYCPYASKFIEQVCTDASIDGAVFPRSCDSSRVIESYLEDCGKFVYQVYVPARQDETAVQFLSDEIQRYQRAVEQWYEIVIDDVAERTELVNKRNQQLQEIYSHLPEISFTDWIRMLHRLLQQPLREQSVSMEHIGSCGEIGKRVFLMGSTLICEDVAKAIEQVGLTVVGDNLPESGRLVSSVEVSTSGNLYENIARGMLQGRLSPTQSAFSSLLEENAIALKHSQAQGVIYITQKYCEPYDYLFPVYKRMADDLGIPVLRLVLNGDGFESAADTTLEAFAEML